MASVRIDPEFRSLIPPLTAEERAGLEEDIKRDGCRDRLIVWQEEGILLDGHNRFDICTSNGIPYEVTLESFASRDDAQLWMLRNQLHRRNLTELDRAALAMRMEAIFKAKAKANQSVGGKVGAVVTNRGLTNLSNPVEPVRTRKEAAAIAGLSEGTYDRAKRVLANGVPELHEAVREGLALLPADAVSRFGAKEQRKILETAASTGSTVTKTLKRLHPECDIRNPTTTKNGKVKVASPALPETNGKTLDPVRKLIHEDGDGPVGSWVDAFPVFGKLGGVARRRFTADATAWRYCRATLKETVLDGPYRKRLRALVGVGPKEWVACRTCNGTGTANGSSCSKCEGDGYTIPEPRTP